MERLEQHLRTMSEEGATVKATVEHLEQAALKRRMERTADTQVPNTLLHVSRSVARGPKANTSERSSEQGPNSGTFNKRQFVYACLTDNPQMRNSDIGRQAQAGGYTISPAYISKTRKAFFAERAPQAAITTDDEEAVA